MGCGPYLPGQREGGNIDFLRTMCVMVNNKNKLNLLVPLFYFNNKFSKK